MVHWEWLLLAVFLGFCIGQCGTVQPRRPRTNAFGNYEPIVSEADPTKPPPFPLGDPVGEKRK